jgi:hypothetical protein
MVYSCLSDVYRDFEIGHDHPPCCGQVHWNRAELEAWLRDQTYWDGVLGHLSPALVKLAAQTSAADKCPLARRGP